MCHTRICFTALKLLQTFLRFPLFMRPTWLRYVVRSLPACAHMRTALLASRGQASRFRLSYNSRSLADLHRVNSRPHPTSKLSARRVCPPYTKLAQRKCLASTLYETPTRATSSSLCFRLPVFGLSQVISSLPCDLHKDFTCIPQACGG